MSKRVIVVKEKACYFHEFIIPEETTNEQLDVFEKFLANTRCPSDIMYDFKKANIAAECRTEYAGNWMDELSSMELYDDYIGK